MNPRDRYRVAGQRYYLDRLDTGVVPSASSIKSGSIPSDARGKGKIGSGALWLPVFSALLELAWLCLSPQCY